ncbi:EPM2AIP1 [Cordylochernes scorpioides]|uniref:EPM2AIP1 n=1 Tax=Cordylochernes scorpioides TaxID=51811 RepID=A0ABY6KV36_9ARAC|nr:EPM2AIP1 [Cordylochernes scorpioides]
MLEEVHGDHSLSKSQCYRWFKKFQSGDFELDNEPRGKPHQKFEDAELQALLDDDSTQTQEKLAKQLQLLKPGETVNTSRYEHQMHSLREALNEKRPELRKKHNKLILQHDNAPAHNATVVKNTIKDLGWELLPHPPYSPDLAPNCADRKSFEARIEIAAIFFTKVKTEQEASTRASFRVALEIAKRGKPFTDGEMIKECIIAVVEEMCPEKVNLLKTVSMSANTVARRVENIAENISSQLFDKNGHVEWFSLALDESTDVSDTAQVLIYIRGVDKSYEVHEELLDMYSIHGTTTGTDIFKGVEMAINKKNLRWKNLKCITTDGGKNMSGKDKGVVALVSKAVENDGGSKPLVLHCIIHQQSLCGKCLDMSDVLKPVISTVNFIRSFGLNHRQFRQFIAEIGETELPYHTAVRWLSCGKVLQRFFELRAVIEIFLNEKHRPLTELQNNAWLWKLAFYVDLTKYVNELNLRLQGENQHLPDLYTNIKSFRMKLILFQSQLRSKCFSHFKTCEIFSHTTETEFPIDFAIETLSALKINFDTRFSDFDAIANQIKIFQNPFDADIETLAPELQMEMIDLQCSDIIKNKYENSSLLEFYMSLPLTQFDNLHKISCGLFSVFGTTYLCEKTFSKMKYTKNVYRSKLTDEHLKSLLIIGTSKISPQLQTIVGGKSQLHTSH